MTHQNRLYIIIIWALACVGSVRGQEGGSVFNFLSLPSSAHASALGGRNISLMDDDASLVLQNPALLSNVSNNSINLNFMTYMQGAKLGSAAFVREAGERGTWGASAQFLGYGKMKETTAAGEVLGDMSALDLSLGGMYSYLFNDYWSGGATGKFIYSKYASYSSVALAVDLGVNYINEESDFSTSLVLANMGGQVKAFGEQREALPFNLLWGFTKGLAHLPIRLSVTLTDLTRWSKAYYYVPGGGEPSAGRIIMNHINLGVDIIPKEQFYLSIGYNIRRANELTAAGSSHAAGLTCGAGVNIKRIKFGLAYAKYHVSVPSFTFSLGYSL
ncbi:MAG: type IX secretion system protein PorQ [Bacteroidales bacterium]|nr:type IX secretion system protein PorQ [Candidatus Physcousia equi]